MKSKPIVVLGDFVCDYVIQVDLPIEPSSVKIAQWSTLEPGGASNFCITGQRLGRETMAVGTVGKDMFGDVVRQGLESEKVNTQHLLVLPNAQTTVVLSFSDVNLQPHAFLAAKIGNAPIYNLTESLRNMFETAYAIYVMGYSLREESNVSLIEYTIELATRQGIPIYADVGPIATMLREEKLRLMRTKIDILMGTEEELLPLGRQSNLEEAVNALFMSPRLQLIVAKRGEQGCSIITRKERRDFPAFQVQVRDTIGCGDAFNAGFIHAHLQKLPLPVCAEFANAVGAVKASKIGPGRNMPTPSEINALLRQSNSSIQLQEETGQIETIESSSAQL